MEFGKRTENGEVRGGGKRIKVAVGEVNWWWWWIKENCAVREST